MILWRSILRGHLGPFLFSNAVIVFLFLLQFLMKSAGDIVGKGLGTGVVLELIALNLAWIVVLAVPMSVLVATLMAFGRMSADNEIMIMRATGMSTYRMIAPVAVASVFLTWGLIEFNNRVLPEANIRLRTLMMDILRIKPTFSLRAGVFTTDDQLPNYRILVRKTYERSDDLEYVTLFDLTRPSGAVLLTARHGKVGFSPDFTKMFMDLDDGEIHERDGEKPLVYRMLRFRRHRVIIPTAGFGFQRSDASSAQRDDRTMSARMMRTLVDSIARDCAKRADATARRTYVLFQTPPASAATKVSFRTGSSPISPPASMNAAGDTVSAVFRALSELRQAQAYAAADAGASSYDTKQMNAYLVEIYKKYSIPVACFVFVFIGAPLGMMARRGGFGVGAGMSLGFFLFYWACLIGGEKLADRGVLSPFVGMWIANIVLGFCGAFLTVRTARETTVIDWSRLARFLPRTWRPAEEARHRNPHEA